MLDSDLTIWYFEGAITESLRTSPRKDYQEMYARAVEKKWMFDLSGTAIVTKEVYAGISGALSNKMHYSAAKETEFKKGIYYPSVFVKVNKRNHYFFAAFHNQIYFRKS